MLRRLSAVILLVCCGLSGPSPIPSSAQSNPVSPGALARDLIAYWPLNEAPGRPRVNLVAQSHVGDLLEYGGDVARAPGHVYENAAHWSGQPSDHYLRLPRAGFGELDSQVGPEASRTFAFWLKMNSRPDAIGPPGYRRIWNRGGGGWPSGGEAINTNQNTVWAVVWAPNYPLPLVHGDIWDSTLPGVWALVFVTIDSTNDRFDVKIWHHGAEHPGDNLPLSSGLGASAPAVAYATLGEPYDATYAGAEINYLDADIGPFVIWNRMLDADERAAFWNTGAGLPYSEIVPARLYLPLLSVAPP